MQAFNILFPKTMDLIGGGTKDEDLKEYLHQAMELIQSFGAQIAVFGSGKCRRCPDNMTYGDAYKRLTEVCWITGEIAKQYGVNIVIEPLSRKETNLICTMAEGAILVEDISLENVGLLADYYHVMSNHDSIGDIRTIRQFGHIHIASANGRRYPLSETNEAYRELYRELHAIGYNGRISIEGKTENIRSDGADALKFLRGLEKEIYG